MQSKRGTLATRENKIYHWREPFDIYINTILVIKQAIYNFRKIDIHTLTIRDSSRSPSKRMRELMAGHRREHFSRIK